MKTNPFDKLRAGKYGPALPFRSFTRRRGRGRILGMDFLQKFEKLLVNVDLVGYRNRYLPIKIVEMDMPKDAQAIDALYKIYWNEKRFIPFEEFYDEYKKRHRSALRTFFKKTRLCRKCFTLGLPARIYRTWASIITQIHAGYVAESVFGDGTVEMSAVLDHAGADFKITYKSKIFNYQVKKESYSREVRQEKKPKKKLGGEFVKIVYKVPNFDTIQNPTKRNGELKKEFSRFKKEWLDTGKIKILPNGFVVFTPFLFQEKKRAVDSRRG